MTIPEDVKKIAGSDFSVVKSEKKYKDYDVYFASLKSASEDAIDESGYPKIILKNDKACFVVEDAELSQKLFFA